MIDLILNTASSNTSFFCSQNGKLIASEKWPANRDEASSILPKLKNQFDQKGLSFTQISRIIVVNGPGSFTGVRIGATIANSLAYVTNAELFQLDQFALYNLKTAGNWDTILIRAGRNEVYIKKNDNSQQPPIICPFNSDILSLIGERSCGDLEENQVQKIIEWMKPTTKKWLVEKDLKNDFEAIYPALPSLKKVDSITPLYLKPPSIT